jgi:hypothetical protein
MKESEMQGLNSESKECNREEMTGELLLRIEIRSGALQRTESNKRKNKKDETADSKQQTVDNDRRQHTAGKKNRKQTTDIGKQVIKRYVGGRRGVGCGVGDFL